MKEIAAFLAKNPVQYLATIGLDGKPKVRPFQFMLEEGGKLYFCTGSQKPVYAEMQKQPYVEITTSSPEATWLRLSGKAVFVDDRAVKERILAQSSLVKSLYQTVENPVFQIFYLEEAKAVLADFSGEPPKEYDL